MSLLPQDTRDSLVARLNNPDDVAAWDEVMAVYGPLVYRVALKQGLQKADAEDVVQEVFLAVLKSVSDWLEQPKRSRFRSWLAGICRNTSLNVLNRKPKGGVGFGGSDALDALHNIEAPISDLTSTFELEYQREVYRWATKQVQSLVSPSTWDAFYQTHVAGRPMDEVAQELGLKVGNVYLARCRVMSRLRELVKQYQEFEHDQA